MLAREQKKQMPKPAVSKDHDANVSELKRIRARSPQALARWIPVQEPEVARAASQSQLGVVPMANSQCDPVRTPTTKAANRWQEVERPKGKEARDRVRTKVRSVSRMNCMLKKLRQDHPYMISRSQGSIHDEMPADAAGTSPHSSQLMCHLELRTRELEKLLHDGEEILSGSNTNLPCIGTPASAASMVFEDSIESPAKRSRSENNGGFISLSSSIDELCQQVSILSKECDLRRSEGFGTPHHSRTPERLELLEQTTDVLHTIHAKVQSLANAHKKAEAHVCKMLNFDTSSDDETLSVASLSVQNSKAVNFHLDDEVSSETSFLPHAHFNSNDEVSAWCSPGWTDFDVNDLPEDGLKAFPLARSPVALKWKASETVFSPLSPSTEDSPSPSRIRKPNDPPTLANQLFPQVDQIQHGMVSFHHELEKAGNERTQMSVSLAKPYRNIQNLENGINSAQRCQHAAATRMTQMLPIEKRCLLSAFCT